MPLLRHTVLTLLACWTMLFSTAGGAGAASTILIVTSERGGAYDETIAAVRTALTAEVAPDGIIDVDWQAFADVPLEQTRVIVTIGALAAHTVDERAPDLPVLNILLPRAAFNALPNRAVDVARSAIFLDQPIARQIAAIIEAMPDWKQLALIAGPQTISLAAELAAFARSAGFSVATAEITSEKELYSAMQRTLPRPAILLALPDRQIFNSHTIQNILLTSYRQHSPLVGFSPAYVRAGALLALYSTPEQIAAEAAEAVRTVLHGGKLPPPRYPRQFEIGINTTVARSLGIRLDSPEAIAARIQRLEPTP